MLNRFVVFAGLLFVATLVQADDTPINSMPSYPITMSATEARQFPSLDFDFAKVQLHTESVTVIPIATEQGITGAVLIGSGGFSYTPEDGKTFEGPFHNALLRFNPQDVDAIIKLDAGKKITDKGALALAQLIVSSTFRHCYHRGNDALIPSPHAIAVDLYSQKDGELLISIDDKTSVVHSFSTNATLYQAK